MDPISKPPQPTLADWGENRLIRELTKSWPTGTAAVPVGVGDDCAVLPGRDAHHWLLLKTDAVVENVHFLPTAPPHLIGRKALARVLSDFASMGGSPVAALVTLGLPRQESISRLKGIYRGLEDLAKEAGINLVGGETTRTQQLFLNIAGLGECAGHPPVLRSTARPGDFIFVTGSLGGTQKRHHLTFTPRLPEGLWLGKEKMASAMMDLSDGLAADLPRLARASGVGYTLDEKLLPRRKGATIAQAVSDGEDYELLFTVNPAQKDRLVASWPFSTAITSIGKIQQVGTVSTEKVSGKTELHGYDHFR